MGEDIPAVPVNEYLVVVPEKREIIVPESEEIFGVYNDRNFAKKYFKCPRIVEDQKDLSKCEIFINYTSASGKNGRYLCKIEQSEDIGFIHFSWVLSSNVFDANKNANIFFAVQAKSKDGSEVFNTRKAQGRCYEGIDAEDEIEEEYADVILQMLARIDEVENSSNQNAIMRIMERLDILEQGMQSSTQDISQMSGRVSRLDSTVESLSSGISDAEAGITELKKRKIARILWSGVCTYGTVEFNIPKSCFHNKERNLTLVIEATTTQRDPSMEHLCGDRNEIVSLTFRKDASGADNPANPWTEPDGTAYAYVYGTSKFFEYGSGTIKIGVCKLNTTDYAICKVEVRDLGGRSSYDNINCIYALVPEDMEG